MKRQFSLAHLTVLGCPPPEMIYIAAMAGYDFASLRIIPLGEPNYDLATDTVLMARTKMALADTGLTVLDIELARILPGLDARTYEPAFAAAAELGAKHVISSLWTPDETFATDTLAALCDLAAPYGLTINLEYLPFVDIRRFAEVQRIIAGADRPNCGFLVDTLYMSPSNLDLCDIERLPRRLINFIHLCDGPRELPERGTPEMFRVVREGRLYVGQGSVDIAGILRRLPPVPCSLELPNSDRVKELGYAEHARRCLRTAQRFVAERVDGPQTSGFPTSAVA